MVGSSLLLDERFDSADPRFVDEVLASTDAPKLKALADRWYKDRRPFAREALFAYLERGADHPHHRPLVKGLLKLAEAAKDDAVMGALMVAFDGFAHRQLVKGYRYDWSTRTGAEVTELKPVRGLLARFPKDWKELPARRRRAFEAQASFTRVTRRYLQRRAWRYFRTLAKASPDRYRAALCAALARYQELALSTPAQLVDAWGLVNALYHGSPVLQRRVAGVVVAAGASLNELAPAPYARAVWADCLEDLLTLFLEARSNTVRTWARQLLERDYAPRLTGLPMATVRRLLRHASPEAQELGARLLHGVSDLDKLPISEWLELLGLDNPAALPLICELVVRHVSPARLTLTQCLHLASAKVAPVAELGLRWARARPIRTEEELDALLALARAGVPSVRVAGAEWVASLLTGDSPRVVERARELLDSNHADVRAVALGLMEREARFGQSPVLWVAMAESPWPQVREALLGRLEAHEGTLPKESLHGLWAAVLLAVRRGARHKRAVALAVAERVVRAPEEAAELLPLLAYTLRSVRPPERRAALAAIARCAMQAPALRAELARAVPELAFVGEEAWA